MAPAHRGRRGRGLSWCRPFAAQPDGGRPVRRHGPVEGPAGHLRIAVKGSGDDAHCRLPSGFTGFATFRSSVPISAVVERGDSPPSASPRYGTYVATPKGPHDEQTSTCRS